MINIHLLLTVRFIIHKTRERNEVFIMNVFVLKMFRSTERAHLNSFDARNCLLIPIHMYILKKLCKKMSFTLTLFQLSHTIYCENAILQSVLVSGCPYYTTHMFILGPFTQVRLPQNIFIYLIT